MSKKLYSILLALIPMLSIAVATVSVEAADPSNWYMTVNGVLSSDYYSLYPYSDSRSLKIGFSKFGELINSNDNVGLEFGTVDPFAPPAGSGIGSIRKVMWVQGWLINVTYLHNTKGWRNVWAAALFSDSTQYGNDWIRVDMFGDKDLTFGWEDPRDPGWYIGNYAAGGMKYGGRKTNGTCVTDPITVLYDGPREFVALVSTTLWDHPVYQTDDIAADIPLVKVMITIVFNKVKKEVKLLKDIKSLISEKDAYQIKVQFSNRGEVDLGTESTGYHSYFHFYTEGCGPEDNMIEGLPTVYNSEWEILKTEIPHDESEPLKYQHMSAAGPFPQDVDATFDVAHAMNPSAGYVWWGAFWPSLSDWSIDGWSEWWRSLEANDPHYIDAAGYSNPSLPKEPKIPFYIGEWDFILEAIEFAPKVEFRGVTVYGISEGNDAADVNWNGRNVIDRETRYQLDEVFNPWDLNSAVHKKTSRYVKFVPGSFSGSITLSPPPLQVGWDGYWDFSERLILLPDNVLWKRGVQYTLTTTGVAGVSIPAGKTLKILWSALGVYVTDEDNANNAGVLGVPDEDMYVYLYGDDSEAPIESYVITPAVNPGMDAVLKIMAYDVDRDGNGMTYPPEIDPVYINGHYLGILSGADGDWYTQEFYVPNFFIKGKTNQFIQVFIDCDPSTPLPQTIDPSNSTTWPGQDAGGWAQRIDAMILEFLPRYEWVVVGRDSLATDSAGSSLVSAAIKNKQIEIGIAGFDMMTRELAGVPYVMRAFGAAPGWPPDYKDSLYRTALRDDWCTNWPVASSNMISVGGPLANHLSEYFNDFTDVLYGLNTTEAPFTKYGPWVGKFVGLTCWNKMSPTNQYASSGSTGYAEIATYKDINGTVGLMVYGITARDTFYASVWLHGDAARGIPPGIHYLQGINDGVTSLIIKINYSDSSHPTFSVIEHLGTVSEKHPIHWDP